MNPRPVGQRRCYLLQDHLKSSSAFVTQGGVVASRNYYLPFGGNRGGTAFSRSGWQEN